VTTLVHITLKKSIREDSAAKQAVLEKLVNDYGVTEVNMQRFERYGIVSGVVSVSEIGKIQILPEVQAVGRDGSKQATNR
jgi:hypothetical protein